jgi:hypothetical protein
MGREIQMPKPEPEPEPKPMQQTSNVSTASKTYEELLYEEIQRRNGQEPKPRYIYAKDAGYFGLTLGGIPTEKITPEVAKMVMLEMISPVGELSLEELNLVNIIVDNLDANENVPISYKISWLIEFLPR